MTRTNKRFALTYWNHGQWTRVPYRGLIFTPVQVELNPFKARITKLRNRVLKNKIRVSLVKV